MLDAHSELEKSQPLSFFPVIDPPVRPLPIAWHKRLFQRLIFISKPRFDATSPFDHDGEKPECYAKRWRVARMERPPYDPRRLFEIIRSTPSLVPKENCFGLPVPIHRVDSSTVVKVCNAESLKPEALSMHMIRTMTTIPVPLLKQLVVDVEHGRQCLVMEYIPGRSLDTCWSELGFFTQLRIAWTLRGYVSQLRRLHRAVPGRIDGSICEGHLCSIDGAGPFESYEHLVSWYNHKLDVSQRAGKAPISDFRYDDSWPLVFTHGDISPRNIILSEDGTLYLIDWGFAGFYPIWHEHTSMVWDSFDHKLPSSWRRWIPFISGPYSYMALKSYLMAWAIRVAYLA